MTNSSVNDFDIYKKTVYSKHYLLKSPLLKKDKRYKRGKKDNVILLKIQHRKISIKISYYNSSKRNEKSINIENSWNIKLDK